jgi:hypothetical protein
VQKEWEMTSNAAPHDAEPAPTGKKLEDLYELIDGIDIAMFRCGRCCT